MKKFFGTNGNSAVKTFGRKLDKAFREGKMPGVSVFEKKQIFDRVKKVFTVKGKEARFFELNKFQKEVSNPLRFKSGDRLDPKEVAQFEKALGPEFSQRYTKRIGSKYNEIVRAEKRQATKDKEQKALAAKNGQNVSGAKKEFSWKEYNDKLKKDLDRRKKSLEKAANIFGQVNGKKTASSKEGDNEASEKDTPNKAQVSNVNVQGIGVKKSGGKPSAKITSAGNLKMYNVSGVGALNRHQKRDFQLGRVDSKTIQNYETLYKTLHKTPDKTSQDLDFQYGGQMPETTKETFEGETIIEKMPEWDLDAKLDAYGAADSDGLANASGSSESQSSPEISASPESSQIDR